MYALRVHTSEVWGRTSVLPDTSERGPPNPSQKGCYLIKLPRLEGWKAELTYVVVTYWDGLHTHRRSPIQVLTGADVEQLI